MSDSWIEDWEDSFSEFHPRFDLSSHRHAKQLAVRMDPAWIRAVLGTRRSGKTVQWFRYTLLGANTSVAPEGAVGNSNTLASTTISGTVQEYADFITITKKINGGTTGLAERRALWMMARKVLGA